MDSIEFSKALFSELPQETSVNSTSKSELPPNNTTTITAEAVSDSRNGMVRVLIEEEVEIETTVSVMAGDICIVSITGNTPVVTGVIAGGDRVMDSINDLLLKRSANLLDLSQTDNFNLSVADDIAATSFTTEFLLDDLHFDAVQTPYETTLTIDVESDDDAPTVDSVGEPIEQEVYTQTTTVNDNSFIIANNTPLSMSGGYILNIRAKTSNISGRILVTASHEGEIELQPTGDEQPLLEEGQVKSEEPDTQIATISEDFVDANILDDGTSLVETTGRYIFEADGDYSFVITIGDIFYPGNVHAEVYLSLETKEFIDATGAITYATELAGEAKESADSVSKTVEDIKKGFDEVKGDLEKVSGTVDEINTTTKPILDSIKEVQGEAASFKEGLQAVIDSTTKSQFTTKNELLQYIADLESNITQTASRIQFSVTESDITDISADAEDSVAQAMEKYLAAQTQYKEAQSTYAKAVSDNAVAANTLVVAKNRYDAVEQQVNDILANEDIAPSDKEAASKILADALAVYEAAQEKYAGIQSMFTEIESDLSKAENILKLAFQKLNECQDSHTVNKAEFNVLSDEINSKVSKTDYDADMQQVNSKYTELSQTAGKLEIDFAELSSGQEVLKYVRFEDGNVILGGSENDARVIITQTGVQFMQGQTEVAHILGDNLFIERVKVTEQLEVKNWKWKQRGGNISFRYIAD